MAIEPFVVSSLVMGGLAVGIGFGVVRRRNWLVAPGEPTAREEPLVFRASDRLAKASQTPLAWGVAFAMLLVVFGGGTLLLLSGQLGSMATIGLAVAGVVVITFYLFYGTYLAGRTYGLGSAASAAAGSWAVGILFLLVLTVKLVTA